MRHKLLINSSLTISKLLIKLNWVASHRILFSLYLSLFFFYWVPITVVNNEGDMEQQWIRLES